MTPINFTTLNINVTNQNNNGADDGAANTFHTIDDVNRIIIELELMGRPKKDLIFDYTITKDTMEEVANALIIIFTIKFYYCLLSNLLIHLLILFNFVVL